MEYLGKPGKVDYRSSRHPNPENAFGKSRKYEYQSSQRMTPPRSFGNTTRNEFPYSSHNRPVHSFGGTANGNGSNNKIPLNRVYYGYGGPFSFDDDFDRSSDITQVSSDSLTNFKFQPWMEKITGGTFKRDYIDRASFRPTLQHDATLPWQDTRQLTEPDDNYRASTRNSNEGKISQTTLTIIFIILGVVLIGIVGGVLAWFLAKKDEGSITTTYYVVSGEMHLNEDFYGELYNSSSDEFKNLSSQFCFAITEVLQKNITKYGERFKHCEVNEFRNGSIIVIYTVYYVYSSVEINKEGVEGDLNVSLIAIDSRTSKLSNLIIITSTINFTVRVETFPGDPIATSVLVTTTPSTTNIASTTTIESLVTTSEPLTITTYSATNTTSEENEKTMETTITSALESTTTVTETTTDEKETELTTMNSSDSKATTDVLTTENPVSTMSAVNSTILTETTMSSTTTLMTEITSSSTTTATTESTLTISTTEKTTENIQSTVKTDSNTGNSTSIAQTTESTLETSITTEFSTMDYSTSTTTNTENTSKSINGSVTSMISTMDYSTSITTEPTIAIENTSKSIDENVTSMTTTMNYSTAKTTEQTTEIENTSKYIKENVTSMISTTDYSTSIKTEPTTEIENTSKSIEEIVTSMDSTTDYSTSITTEPTSAIDNISKSIEEIVTSMASTMDYSTLITTEPTTEIENTSQSTEESVILTTSSPPTTDVEYSADVNVPDIVATVGEITLVRACEVIPKGSWLYVNISVIHQETSIVKEKYDHSKNILKLNSHERISINIYMKDDNVVANLTLNLTTPTSSICNLYDQYIVSCSVIMNDTFHTTKSNGSRISVTAPMASVSIDSKIHYNEGETMYFNCSTKVDPNYSVVKVHLIKNNRVIQEITTSDFGTNNNSDCSVNVNWINGSPFPLTADENGVKVRCIVTNTLLNKTEFAEKVLNVTISDVAFSQYSYKMLTEESTEIKCIARGASSILENLTLSRNDKDIAVVKSSGDATVPIPGSRYNASKEQYDGNVILSINIAGVKCEDHGTYICTLYTKDNSIRTSPNMSFIVIGTKPTLSLHPDIYETFPRRDSPHVCTTDHRGLKDSEKYLEIQVIPPHSASIFKYTNQLPESEKFFDTTKNLTYINITGPSQFILVSDHTSNSTCNNKQVIKFLLSLTMDFTNGTIRCVLKDDVSEFASVESQITVIPRNYCDEYEHESIRKYPSNACYKYVYCYQDRHGKMYAFGRQCEINQCVSFAGRPYCQSCNSANTCEDLTTAGPLPTTTSLPPGKQYVACNDSSHSIGTNLTVTCNVLDKRFTSLNITFLPVLDQEREEFVGEALSNGSIHSQSISDMVLSADFASSPMILSITFIPITCGQIGKYKIIATGTNASFAPSVEIFDLNAIVKPANPEMKIDEKFELGKNDKIHSCSGNVGNPAGSLAIEIRNGTSGNFTTYTQSIQSTDPHVMKNCTYYQKLYFSIDLTSNNLTDHYIRCVVSNPYTIESTDKLPASEEVRINPLPYNVCYNAGLHPHPGDCRRFLNCDNNVTNILTCPSRMCFGQTTCVTNCTFCIP